MLQFLQERHKTVCTLFPPVFCHRIKILNTLSYPLILSSCLLTRRNHCRSLGCHGHIRHVCTLRICISGLFSFQHSDSHSEIGVKPAGRHLAILQHQIEVGGVFKIKVGIVGSVARSCLHQILQLPFANLEYVQIIILHSVSFASFIASFPVFL